MSRIRSTNELILSSLDFLRVAQPLLTTNPGSVSRDLIIDGPSAQLSRLYDELNQVSNLQSLRNANGSDLDKLAKNYGAVREQGAKATGSVLFTFNSLDADFGINKGDIVTAKNGATFTVSNSVVISTVLTSTYKSIAAKYQADLDFLGITDQYAVQILVEAASSGTQGNISKYNIIQTSISGVNHATNVSPFGGGKGTENDASFRRRILSIFSGSNTGTSLGYKNAVLADPSVIDAVVIEPGDPLMTRDGTQVSIAADGTRTIISEGTGGKIDVLLFGTRLQEVVDSYVYHDLSNTNDPTNTKNNFVLGQIAADSNKTVSQKRLANLQTGVLPNQPINNIVSVSGSISGPNFVEKTVDDLGRISGNYELIKDTGAFGGSPWGFDSLHWISDRISDFPEDKTKVSFNSQDPLSYPDVLEITTIQQNKLITNENSKVSPSNRSSVQLAHFPVSNVTRVLNATTGERYIVVSQNPDGDGTINNTGRIIISGKSLPAVSDILQVDYTWLYNYDPYFDFDNKLGNKNIRTVQDSIDWGYSNNVRREQSTLSSSGSFLNATVTHPISAVISVNVFTSESATVGLTSGRLSVAVLNSIDNIVSIVRTSDNAELWNTSKLDGTFSGLTAFLPTDSSAVFGDLITIVYNSIDVFNASTPGSFNNNVITIVPSTTATPGKIVECNYIANVNTLVPATLLSSMPIIRAGNSFNTKTNQGIGTQPTSHIFDISGLIFSNLRQAPSNLSLKIDGSISPGVLTITGTTITAVMDVVFTCSNIGLKIDLSSAIKGFLGLSSKTTIPTNIRVGRLVKLEKVETTTSLDVLSTLVDYDITGYHIYDNSFVKSESVSDSTLKLTEIQLPATSTNNSNLLNVGDRIRARFYLTTTSDTENVSFSKSGTLFTNKKFGLVDSIVISSGFTSGSSASATLTVSNLNQPDTRSRYKVFYNYLAPKANERITIDFNYQKLITDATLNIESTRPINADVLAKMATPILVDITLNIVVISDFINSSSIVVQNVQDAVTSGLNANKLATTIDSSDLETLAASVSGVDRVRVLHFNKTGQIGSVLSITAQKNEYIVANSVIINLETR